MLTARWRVEICEETSRLSAISGTCDSSFQSPFSPFPHGTCLLSMAPQPAIHLSPDRTWDAFSGLPWAHCSAERWYAHPCGMSCLRPMWNVGYANQSTRMYACPSIRPSVRPQAVHPPVRSSLCPSIRVRAIVRACVRACVRASVRACVRASVRASLRACEPACERACVHACERASVRDCSKRASVRACEHASERACVR